MSNSHKLFIQAVIEYYLRAKRCPREIEQAIELLENATGKGALRILNEDCKLDFDF